jgi:hypothetical protein
MNQLAAWTEEYLRQITDCERRESRLTDWERTFIDSLRRQIEDGRAPTPKQVECLDKAWERATARG